MIIRSNSSEVFTYCLNNKKQNSSALTIRNIIKQYAKSIEIILINNSMGWASPGSLCGRGGWRGTHLTHHPSISSCPQGGRLGPVRRCVRCLVPDVPRSPGGRLLADTQPRPRQLSPAVHLPTFDFSPRLVFVFLFLF